MNSEDQDEMPHNAGFHQEQHYLLDENDIQGKKHNFYLKSITCDPSIYIMGYPKFIVSSQKEESISAYRVYYLLLGIFPCFFLSSADIFQN